MSLDVFKDLGFSAAESAELKLRSVLMSSLLKVIEHHSYTQKELIETLKLAQPHVSALMNGKIANFSAEKLTAFLEKLHAEIKIEVQIPKFKVVGDKELRA